MTYPAIDQPLPLANGDVVQLFNLIVFVKSTGEKTLSIQYGTDVQATDRSALVTQAVAVATALTEYADSQGIYRGSAQICRTRAQAEVREAITEIIPLVRSNGVWREDSDASRLGA